MKFLVIGHARHGKDTVSDLMEKNHGFTHRSSSMHNAEHTVYPVLKDKYGYKTVEECFNDRGNHRKEWYDLIAARCSIDPAAIGREIFEVSDIYCGLRNKREFHGIKNNGLVDYTIWVDRSDHLPPESKDSMSLEPWMADFIIDNNGTLEDLERNVSDLMSTLTRNYITWEEVGEGDFFADN
jgi:hypothetical protein